MKVELRGVFEKGKNSGYFRTKFKGDDSIFQGGRYIEFVFQIGEIFNFFKVLSLQKFGIKKIN
jgi:hypothetical protein